MKNVLLINSSLNGENGNSHQLSEQFIAELTQKTDITVTRRDVAENSLPHLTQAEMGAWMTEPSQRSDEQNKLAAISDELVTELQNNKLIVMGVPMYNFGIPSTLKAWIDRVARAGITFKYTETGPVGLVENTKVVILAARGGMYLGTDMDTQTKYLKDFFAFLGINDVDFIYAEGLNMPGGDDSKNAASKEISDYVSAL
ncbi:MULTISPECIES: FMN-dependent NADH-azoreductase [Pseudoalteromonas]|uniref:FMN-dependent NADH-azoreductase n=1 Tax=Pseudoalteromonas TaxID=53246 RepID=UPI001602BC18|nr:MULTISPECIES: NAD(P)H-dependent oxidoreductase [Pseudoalteromonas]MBB1300641.1 NAD(P)H-dependent oxidoreductase [Pseudoalteromonas sp. SR44-8]MBB1309435.1 NAD(P)H-dependent oxidoreductase [Pseudoalteromonas sp. SR41-8]MBB1409079.1 NAD(P)H-dependent oxidoreductase [Pseudoalteromonas sp. SG44-17]MBB1505244.1 NAD(P)H-dependent oxidoreductase [Pseudoalteromonas sp. SG41-1]